MKYLDKIDMKWFVIIFLLASMYYGYTYVQKNYVEVLITSEGEFLMREGHLLQITTIDLYKGAE